MTAKQVAVITGAARGIGRCTAERLAAKGYSLALIDIAPLEQTREALLAFSIDVLEIPGDVSDETVSASAAASVLQHYGRVDALINNAGISHIQSAEATQTGDWGRVLGVNLTGPFLLCRSFGALMLKQGHGAIVNVASIAGVTGVPRRAAYAASKHGLIGLTRTLAAEWGDRGIRCNAVCPGIVDTEMEQSDRLIHDYTDDDIKRRIPLARYASPQEVAEAIAFLSDDQLSGFVNGIELRIDGGWLADGGWERTQKA